MWGLDGGWHWWRMREVHRCDWTHKQLQVVFFFSLSHPYSSLLCAEMVVCDSYRAQPGRAALKMKKECGGRGLYLTLWLKCRGGAWQNKSSKTCRGVSGNQKAICGRKCQCEVKPVPTELEYKVEGHVTSTAQRETHLTHWSVCWTQSYAEAHSQMCVITC